MRVVGGLLIAILFVILTIVKLHNYDRTPEVNHGEELMYA